MPRASPRAKPPKMTFADDATVADVDQLLKLQEANKAAYREIDGIEERIFAAMKAAKTARMMLPDARIVMIKDNYQSKNTAFKTCAFRRQELLVS